MQELLAKYFIRRTTAVLDELPPIHKYRKSLYLTTPERRIYDYVNAMNMHALARITRQRQGELYHVCRRKRSLLSLYFFVIIFL